MTTIEGGVTAPKGFRAAGVAAGIKKNGKPDCAMVVSDCMATVAGTFTTNIMKAPPVEWDAAVCAKGRARAVFINSGNANACTGEGGRADARTTASWVAQDLGCATEEVCVSSTGVIGVRLPMDKLEQGVHACTAGLAVEGGHAAATAIMTTDTVSKETARELTLGGQVVRLGAMAKGSGMISPNMATMIAIITTDAAIEPDVLAPMLRECVEVSFNRIAVDNDMSTSDTVLCFANGQAGAPTLSAGSADYDAFKAALTDVCQEMARKIVEDGEGATKFVEVNVTGAPDHDAAKTIARAIAHSHLCKTAFFGQDPNWGRIACATGYAGVPFEADRLALWLDDLQVVRHGMPTDYQEADAAAIMQQRAFRIRVDIGAGSGTAVFWTADLSHDYVSINADYRS